jgi:predicted permease
MNSFLQDLRYALRTLAKSPGFTAAAVATLALGIGANTAIFSVVDAVLLRPLPGVREPGRLLWITNRLEGRARPLSYLDFVDQHERSDSFAGLMAFDRRAVHVATGGEAERVEAEIVSGEFFSVLRVEPFRGRTFLPDDERQARPVAVLSHAYWQRKYQASDGAVGSALTINGQPYMVVGVAPPGFIGLDLEKLPDIYVNLTAWMQASRRREMINRNSAWLGVMGRLRPGVSAPRASAQVATVAAQSSAERAADKRKLTASTEPVRGFVPPGHGGDILPLALLGLAATGLLLLIAAGNVASLLLARAAARRREIGIRLALGASRGRIIRLLLTESVLLAVLGAGLGALISGWSLDVLLSRLAAPPGIQPSLDRAVLLYTTLVAVGASLVFGLAPAWSASRANPASSVKDAAAGSASRSRLQGALVATQMALCVVLLAAAGLFLRSLEKAAFSDVGLDRKTAASVLAVSFDLETQGYSKDGRQTFERTLLERAASTPGVVSAALAEILPLAGRAIGDSVAPEGQEAADGEAGMTFTNSVSPGYFRTLGIPLVAGRDFQDSDRPGAAKVAVINELLARRFWPTESALGKRLRVGSDPGLHEVVGVARDGKYVSLTEEPRPFLYLPLLQHGAIFNETVLLARSEPGAAILGALRDEARGLDPALPLFHVRTMAESLDGQLSDRRQGTLLIAVFGALALLLAAVGLYGVVAYSVTGRTREIGVRMALGAARRDVVALFVGRGARLALIGVGAGLVLSAGLTRLLVGMLFGVGPTDAATFAGVSLLLTAVAMLASWLPARRAARIDPMEALRNE